MSVLDQETGIDHAALAAMETAGPEAAVAQAHAEAPSGIYLASGQCEFTTILVWGVVLAELTFGDGRRMRFSGWHLGLGLGAAASAGAATFSVPPAELVGSGTYAIGSTAGVAGAMSISFFKNNVLVGSFVGASIGMDLSVAGGAGTWAMD